MNKSLTFKHSRDNSHERMDSNRFSGSVFPARANSRTTPVARVLISCHLDGGHGMSVSWRYREETCGCRHAWID